MTAVELLKECRRVLIRAQRDEQMAMVSKIEDYLTAPPSERAMEVAE